MVDDNMYLDNTYLTLEVYNCASDSEQAYAIFNTGILSIPRVIHDTGQF